MSKIVSYWCIQITEDITGLNVKTTRNQGIRLPIQIYIPKANGTDFIEDGILEYISRAPQLRIKGTTLALFRLVDLESKPHPQHHSWTFFEPWVFNMLIIFDITGASLVSNTLQAPNIFEVLYSLIQFSKPGVSVLSKVLQHVRGSCSIE
jgi:hypothetical protein